MRKDLWLCVFVSLLSCHPSTGQVERTGILTVVGDVEEIWSRLSNCQGFDVGSWLACHSIFRCGMPSLYHVTISVDRGETSGHDGEHGPREVPPNANRDMLKLDCFEL